MTKSKLRRKGLLWLTCLNHSPLREAKTGTQIRQDMKAEADAEAMEGCCLLAVFPDFLSLLSYKIQEHQPMDDISYNVLGSVLLNN